MTSRVKQSAKGRAGARIKIRSNYPNKKLTFRVPRGVKLRVKKV